MANRARQFQTQQQRDAKPARPKQPRRARRDLVVDTALPGVSATDRKAARSERGTSNRSTSAGKKGGARLEPSSGARPSRKSTRRSTGRVKRTNNLELKAKRSLHGSALRAAAK